MLMRPCGRMLLAAPFINDGVDATRHPEPHVAAARPAAKLLARLTGRSEVSDADLAKVVRAHGVLTVVASLLLALGKAPRTSAVTLAVLTAPRLLSAQPLTVPSSQRSARTQEFVRVSGLLGAVVIAAADTQGRPSVRWRLDQARQARAEEHSDQ